MTPQERATIRTRAAAATRGPWTHQWMQSAISSREGVIAMVVHFVRYPSSGATAQDNDNAACIAHARTDVPALLDEADRLQTFIERLWRAQRRLVDFEG
jgi:hypothetical protein